MRAHASDAHEHARVRTHAYTPVNYDCLSNLAKISYSRGKVNLSSLFLSLFSLSSFSLLSLSLALALPPSRSSLDPLSLSHLCLFSLSLSLYTYIYTHICMYIYIYVCIHIHALSSLPFSLSPSLSFGNQLQEAHDLFERAIVVRPQHDKTVLYTHVCVLYVCVWRFRVHSVCTACVRAFEGLKGQCVTVFCTLHFFLFVRCVNKKERIKMIILKDSSDDAHSIAHKGG